MLLAKENLEGVEVTVKYAAYPKDLLKIVYGETDYYFYAVLVYSFNYCFYINLRSFEMSLFYVKLYIYVMLKK